VVAAVIAATSLAAVMATLPGASPAAAAGTTPAGSLPPPKCSDHYFPVTMGVTSLRVHGTLCLPAKGNATTVQVLEPGATYNAGYWDPPVDGGAYSYVDHATAAGYATLALDRVGTGLSGHPASTLVTGTGEAQVVHEVITQLHTGHAGVSRFDRVALVGHSLGSLISVIEASTYHDEQAVILTGWSTSIDAAAVLADLEPATDDPDLHVSDSGYETTKPGTREALFDDATDVDPAVVAWDEATKDTVSTSEVSDSAQLGESPAELQRITVPVLVADGSADTIMCEAPVNCSTAAELTASVAADFAPAARLTATVLATAGHDNSLAANAGQWYAAATAWLTSVGLR
jgi:pimeloyl-ACP methyl ester carboxylesterase